MDTVRRYGKTPYQIVVVHGGPGAAGELQPLASTLGRRAGILEPFQTKDTVEGQVKELRQQIIVKGNPPVILVGWSWGAFLSILLASRHPEMVKRLVLIGCAPLIPEEAKDIMQTRYERLDPGEVKELKKIMKVLSQVEDTDENTFERFGDLMEKADVYNEIEHEDPEVQFDMHINMKVWNEASGMRSSGDLLKELKKIECPITAIHGKEDPHPWEGVKVPLMKIHPDAEFHLLDRCGHRPWFERHSSGIFFREMERILIKQ